MSSSSSGNAYRKLPSNYLRKLPKKRSNILLWWYACNSHLRNGKYRHTYLYPVCSVSPQFSTNLIIFLRIFHIFYKLFWLQNCWQCESYALYCGFGWVFNKTCLPYKEYMNMLFIVLVHTVHRLRIVYIWGTV